MGSPMGTNCTPLVAGLVLVCYHVISLDEKQADIVEAFNSTSGYLDYLLNINNIYFEQVIDQIYPELSVK